VISLLRMAGKSNGKIREQQYGYLKSGMRTWSLLLVFIFFWYSFSIQGQHTSQVKVHNFSRSEYHSENQNWSIDRDQDGFVFGANNVGLIEFDGVGWKYHPSPRGSVIRSVAVNGDNRIYTSGYREIGYWERDRFGKLEYTSLNNLAEPLFAKNEEFWNTVIIGDRVYFHSFSSIFIYEHERFKVVRTGSLIHSISNVNGTLVMDISGEGLYRLNDTVPEPFLNFPELQREIVHFCLPLQGDTVLIGTASSGMFMYAGGELLPYLYGWRSYFMENKINRGIMLSGEKLIIGTLLDGVLVFDRKGNLLHHCHKGNGLQNNTVLGLCSYGINSFWVALDQGVDFISLEVDPSYTIYEYEEIGAAYSAVLFQGDLFLCTNQGVFYRDWGDEEDAFQMVPGTQGQAWSAEVFDNEMLISHNSGTFRIENHRAQLISPVAGGFSIIRNPFNKDELIQSTYSNIVVFDNSEGSWNYRYQLPGFIDLIRYLELDHMNNLWASHMHRGVFRLLLSDDRRSIQTVSYYGEDAFGKDIDIQVFKLEKRIVFTTGEGIFTYDDFNDSIVPFESLNDQLGIHSLAHRIINGPDHYYWFIGKTSIGLFHFKEGIITKIREFPVQLFRDHLISGYENIYPIDSVTGLLCLDNGFAILKAGKDDISQGIESKSPILHGITIRDRTGTGEKISLVERELRLPFNRNSVTLEYAFPEYSSEPISFQYYLEGLGATWSDAQDQPVFQFTRIPAGEYRIRVRAFNAWNRFSQEAEMILMVQRPWYLSSVSIIIYGLFFVGILLLARALLVRRIKFREKRIRESKERELIRLRNEKLNAELSHQSKELANSTMAIIKKNEFLIQLKETIKQQKEELGVRYPDKYHNSLIKKIDQNISSMDDWKVFEFHFEKAHEKFLQKLHTEYPQLSHSDLRLCAYLRMNLSSKEIAPLLRISYRGVENHRYRLRKKLHLTKETDLTDFMLSI